jgi:hypothetical protein
MTKKNDKAMENRDNEKRAGTRQRQRQRSGNANEDGPRDADGHGMFFLSFNLYFTN